MTTRGDNTLDFVCISDSSCIDKLKVEESFALSDHKSVHSCAIIRVGSQKMSSCSNNITIQKKLLVLKS